jgi:NAD(P)-dependent dehydrogenase (short-subunit alcohol dehydrogenase family)
VPAVLGTNRNPPPFPLAGQTVVVTGAGSGIGRGLARWAAAHGCPVAISDKNEAGLAETERGLSGVPVLARPLDVADRDAQFTLAEEIRGWSPAPLGAVVNNAGVTVFDSVADVSEEDFRWVMEINFWGVVHGTQAFLPWLTEQNSGAVVNVSSLFGIIGWPSQAAYNAAKFAVRGFTESLRHELTGTNVRAVSIHPGGVKTDIARHARFQKDDLGRTSREAIEAEFDKLARLTPDKAAEIILGGVERGRVRVRVGSDAVAGDLLQRVAPVRYYEVIRRLEPVIRGR